MASDILKNLNPQQKEAVCHDRGPLLIIAGAGTGKTSVITRRIAYLIETKKALPEEIVALTFTEKAAANMEEGVDILVPYGYTNVWISTFHAFGDRILRENALVMGLDPNFKVLTRPEQIIFFRENLFSLPVSYFRPLSDPTRFIEALAILLSRAKDEDISPKDYADYAMKLKHRLSEHPGDEELKELLLQQEEIAGIYARYQELTRQNNRIDFGDQAYLSLKLLREHALILKSYQRQFKYILVDEFQDTNYVQFELVKLLAGKDKNLTVVGDDDQSIYKFRGAAISNILNFMDTYPEAKKVVLTRNYRSTQTVLDCAYRLIVHNNPDRLEIKCNIDKRLKGGAPCAHAVSHFEFDTVSSEADGVAKIIEKKIRSGRYTYSDFAILVRSNNDADHFIRALNMKNIPWRFSGNQGLYSRAEIRLLVSFLKVISNLADSISLFHLVSSEIYKFDMVELNRIMSVANRNNRSLFHLFVHIDTFDELGDISPSTKKGIENILKDVEKFSEVSRELTTGRLLYKFLTETGYLKLLIKSDLPEADEKVQNIAKFFEIVKNFETIAKEDRVVEFSRHLDSLIEAGDDPATVEADIDTHAVNILTVHKAKGLEFTAVFLVSLVMGKFPWPKRKESIEFPAELIKEMLPSGDFHTQEERRLFYVGMTRAKKELYLTYARDYGGVRERRVSQFVLEAFGLAKPQSRIHRTSALEVIERHAPQISQGAKKKKTKEACEPLTLSYYHIDDYLTCPLKYKYVHILRVPVLQHHSVVYGKAVHDAVQYYHLAKIKNKTITIDDVLSAFRLGWVSEGFLTREHEEERFKVGEQALKRFFDEQEKSKQVPALAEEKFRFTLTDNLLVKGRWDRIDMRGDAVTIIDFKTSEIKKEKDAHRRAKESLQLSIYSLAYKEKFGKIPDAVELHFIESGMVGVSERTGEDIEEAIQKIKEVSRGIRKQDFSPGPRYLACRYCAFSKICPHTASG
ncbi:MAG: ATP-dependent DNA helicase [Candidatus Omnitrophota bacterium]